MLCIGCADPSNRAALTGTVTLDGKALPKGSFELIPIQGTKGPTSGGEIVNGKLYVEQQRSVMPGIYRVNIKANRPSGKKEISEYTGEEIEIPEQYLPARYNQKSELSIEVTSSGKNDFEFKLESE